MLFFTDGQCFASGVAECSIRPAASSDRNSRLFVTVEIEGITTEAVVDTGAPYFICAPAIAKYLELDKQSALEEAIIGIRGTSVKGSLYRLTLVIPATDGESFPMEVTTFIPDATEENWNNLPSFLGFTGCLEWLRFAYDPFEERFFFGYQQ